MGTIRLAALALALPVLVAALPAAAQQDADDGAALDPEERQQAVAAIDRVLEDAPEEAVEGLLTAREAILSGEADALSEGDRGTALEALDRVRENAPEAAAFGLDTARSAVATRGEAVSERARERAGRSADTGMTRRSIASGRIGVVGPGTSDRGRSGEAAASAGRAAGRGAGGGPGAGAGRGPGSGGPGGGGRGGGGPGGGPGNR